MTPRKKARPNIELRVLGNVFYKWAHILTCTEASLGSRLTLWNKTVAPALLWCLETTRLSVVSLQRLRSTQNAMVRKMMRCKRMRLPDNTVEPWVAWQIRTLRNAANRIQNAANRIQQHEACAVVAAVRRRASWASHIARMGTGDTSNHLLKAVICWRNKFWWNEQALWNSLNSYPLRHVYFKPRRWEDNFPPDWLDSMK